MFNIQTTVIPDAFNTYQLDESILIAELILLQNHRAYWADIGSSLKQFHVIDRHLAIVGAENLWHIYICE